MTKEEYERYITPDVDSMKTRIMEAMAKGVVNAKTKSEQKKRYIEAKQRWKRRRELSEKYDI